MHGALDLVIGGLFRASFGEAIVKYTFLDGHVLRQVGTQTAQFITPRSTSLVLLFYLLARVQNNVHDVSVRPFGRTSSHGEVRCAPLF